MNRREFMQGMIFGSVPLVVPDKVLSALEVNSADKYRGVRYATEEVGRLELATLCETAEFEEAWVYIPKKGMFYEIGVKAMTTITPSSRQAIVHFDTQRLLRLFDEYSQLSLYHIHPSVPQCLVDSLFDAFPSQLDLSTFVNFTTLFKKRQPQGYLGFHIVSARGTTSVALREEMESQPLDDFSVLTSPHEDVENYYAQLVEDLEGVSTVEDVIDALDFDGFDVTYTPHQRLYVQFPISHPISRRTK